MDSVQRWSPNDERKEIIKLNKLEYVNHFLFFRKLVLFYSRHFMPDLPANENTLFRPHQKILNDFDCLIFQGYPA